MITEKEITNYTDYSEKIITALIANQLPIVIWGFGGMISFICDNLKKYGIRVDYIIENNTERCGLYFEGIPIISFTELKAKYSDCNILIGVVTKRFVNEITNQIKTDGQYKNVFFFELFYPFGNYTIDKIKKDLKSINAVIEFLADEKSKIVYKQKIRYLATKELGSLDFVRDNERNQYYDEELIDLTEKDGLFIDRGAYHGENTDALFHRFSVSNIKSICIDADENNIAFLKNKYKNRKNVDVRLAALHEKNGTITFSNSGDRGGKVSEHNEGNIVPTIGIDDEYRNQKIAFIKLDIEGSEKECLTGAKQCILRDKPILAICIYHTVEDHWEIPYLIKKLRPDYKIYIRHYHYMGIETVVYAI